MAAGRGSRRTLRPLLVAASASAVTSAPSCGYLMGQAATFDLSPTTRKGEPSYRIVDGDIPCTPKIEENHTYVYNVCDDVTPESVPPECWRHGAAGAYRIDASGKCEAIGTWAGGSRLVRRGRRKFTPFPLTTGTPHHRHGRRLGLVAVAAARWTRPFEGGSNCHEQKEQGRRLPGPMQREVRPYSSKRRITRTVFVLS